MRITERHARETGRDYALRILKDNIIHLELAPGERVSENELAVQMKLSRTPVREALIELSKVRIIEIYPQRGSVVSLVDHDLVEEARFMRTVLESAVVELMCLDATEEQLIALEHNIRLQEFFLEDRDTEKLLELDNQFHQMLFQMTNKMQIYTLMNSLTIHFDRIRSMSMATVKELKTVSDHRAILEAIRCKDTEAAKQTMVKHLTRDRIDEDAIRAKYPGCFR